MDKRLVKNMKLGLALFIITTAILQSIVYLVDYLPPVICTTKKQ